MQMNSESRIARQAFCSQAYFGSQLFFLRMNEKQDGVYNYEWFSLAIYFVDFFKKEVATFLVFIYFFKE